MTESYYTIAGSSEGSYKEKGSRFLSYALPVLSLEEVKKHLHAFEKKYFDARHICYAYIVGHEKEHQFGSDAGEPKHSAGDPILGQIRSADVTNVLVIVVRYFGGTKLGIPGLVQAYRQAAADALSNSQKIEKQVMISLQKEIHAAHLSAFMRTIKQTDSSIVSQEYQPDGSAIFHIETPIRWKSFWDDYSIRNSG